MDRHENATAGTPLATEQPSGPAAAQITLSLAIRGATLLSRFVLVVYLAKRFEPADVGIYGLFAASVSYALYFIGLDFYTYLHRYLIERDRDDWGPQLWHTLFFYAASYTVVIIGVTVVYGLGWVSFRYVLPFLPLLVLEHLSMEAFRLLTLLERLPQALTVAFMRIASWVPLCIWWLETSGGTISTVFLFWLAGSGAGAVVGMVFLRDLKFGSAKRVKLDWRWLLAGIRVSAFFLLGTLALRGLFTFDRYLAKLLGNNEMVGIYTLFFGLAAGLLSLVEQGVLLRAYPRLLGAISRRDWDAYRRGARQAATTSLVLMLALSVVVMPLLDPFLAFIGRPQYALNVEVFWWVFLALSINLLAVIPHYALYGLRADGTSVSVNAVTLVAFLLIGAGMMLGYGIAGLAIALALSTGLLLIGRSAIAVGLIRRSPTTR